MHRVNEDVRINCRTRFDIGPQVESFFGHVAQGSVGFFFHHFADVVACLKAECECRSVRVCVSRELVFDGVFDVRALIGSG